jgi:autotransporter passenger strand-loop-strand repeat protein
LSVLSVGPARSGVVASAGTLKVSSGGTASATTVLSGGNETVFSGGRVLRTVLSGGTLTVSSGATILGGLTLHGGRAVISGTMAAGQTATFVGVSGVLELDNLAGFKAKISGLSDPSDKIDLGGFTFSAGESVTWVQSGTSGTLGVTDGAKHATLTLIGSYTASSFHLTSDGHGGTFVADPPAAIAGATTRFAQALASLSTPTAANTVPVSASGASSFAETLHATSSASGRA